MISGRDGLLPGSSDNILPSSCLAPAEYCAGIGDVTPRMIFSIRAGSVGASNARLRAQSSYNTQPIAQTSDLVL